MAHCPRCLLAVTSLLALGLSGSGCSEDSPSPPDDIGRVEVELLDMEDFTPQEGVKLVLMDAERNRAVRDPVRSDAAGRAHFHDLPDGRYALLAYPGGGIGIFHQPGSFRIPVAKNFAEARAGAGQSDDGLVAPFRTPPVPAAEVTILTFTSAHYEDVLPRIAGTIVAADTGEPLARAFISLPSHVSGYAGLLWVSDDVTGVDGQFLVADIPFAYDDMTQNIFQIQPLVVSREGYVPLTWFHQPSHGDINVDISGVRIELQPLHSAATGALTGQVTYLGEPVPDLLVGIAATPGPYDPGRKKAPGTGKGLSSPPPDVLEPTSGVGLVGQVAVTDSLGRYVFSDLPVGWYLLHPGYLADDDYVFFSQEADRRYEIAADSTSSAQTLSVRKAVSALEPWPGQIATMPVGSFRWSAVAEADSYRVYLDRGHLGTFAGTEYHLPEGDEILAGEHIWFVAAMRQDSTYVGVMERATPFAVR